MEPFPLKSETVRPVERFNINGKWLSLYDFKGRALGFSYSLYWDGETNPVQHNMSLLEVLHVLATMLPATSE